MGRELLEGGPGITWNNQYLKINSMTSELYTRQYGSFYAYNKTIAMAITVQDTYHAIHLITAGDIVTGLVSGFEFYAGRVVDANITSEANGTGGKLRIVCSAAHGLSSGALVVLGNMNNAGHNKPTTISLDGTNPTTEFLCEDITYVAGAGTSAGTVIVPAYLRAEVGADGVYLAAFTICGTAAAINKLWKFELNSEVTAHDNVVTERLSTASLATMSAGDLINVVAGDRIWISGKNITDTGDYSIKHLSLSLTKA